jgi:hypothetical protein
MSAKYLLPCHDGKTATVTTADAGRTVVCPCGRKVQVPTLREVQSLPRADDPNARPAAPAWTAQQGAMFTGGLCLLVVGLVAVGILYNRWREIDTTKPNVDAQLLAEVQKAVTSAEPASTLDGWYYLRYNPLPDERDETSWEINRRRARPFVVGMIIGGVLAAVGLAMTIGGPFWRPAPGKKAAARKRPPAAVK